ncbi:hypothetical protein [Streptomyces sp. M2CJ-2]|uniref:hypothetical protein n=1 Tax=Streptomyces sp. M2CJ-2 TaxID=2803948 RepID=UPI0027DE1ADC|nr:hypothetical protein [Streptomyces sp. M2CJ-2]
MWKTNVWPAAFVFDHWIGCWLWWLVSKPFTLYVLGLTACAFSLPNVLTMPNTVAEATATAPA